MPKVTTLLITFLALYSTAYSKLPPLRIASYNIRNFQADSKASLATRKKELYKVLKSTRADIIAVQEIVDHSGFKKFIRNYLPKYRVALSECGGFAGQKLGFVYNSSVYELQNFYEDSRLSVRQSSCRKGLRPAAIAHFKKRKTRLKFAAIAVHLKAGGGQRNADTRYAQFKQITKIIRELKNDNVRHYAVMGDFNTTDYLTQNHNYDRFVEFVMQNKLIDFSEDLECTSYWWGGIDDGLMHGSVLDHILVSESLYDSFDYSSTEIKAHCYKNSCANMTEDELGSTYKNVSDHCPVVANLK
ncbi:MAG: endonuclease/exonuclease/phosphatase family protein [Bacteriovoracaceae bacterium]|nr:endonuclease/exonuclease/phosphatase family protein [Bacteriovoracaceae bacterium]